MGRGSRRLVWKAFKGSEVCYIAPSATKCPSVEAVITIIIITVMAVIITMPRR